MIGHQTIGPDPDPLLASLLCEEVPVDFLVAVFKEDRLAAVSPLCDVMWNAGKNHAGKAGHGRTYHEPIGWGICILSTYSVRGRRVTRGHDRICIRSPALHGSGPTAYRANCRAPLWGVTEPSGFFQLPNSENISAVIVNPQGTLVKFNRLGYVAGFGDRRVRMTRLGFRRHDGNQVDRGSLSFTDEVHAPGYTETWVEGMIVLHNPAARYPLDPGLLPGASHEFLQPDGQIMSLIPESPVLFSQTSIHLEGDHGPGAED